MAGTIITAEAIIRAKDETGQAFAAITAKVEQLGRKLGQVGKASALKADLDQIQQKLAAIDRFKGAMPGFVQARARFTEAKAAVEQAAKAMTAAAAPARELERAYAQAQREVKAASAAFERHKAAVIGAKAALSESGVSAGRLAADERQLRGAVDGVSAALSRQNAQLREAAAGHGRLNRMTHFAGETGRHLMVGGAMAGGGYIAARGIEGLAHEGALYQHERVRMSAAGMTPEEMREAEDEASKLSGKYRAFSPGEILHVLRNARSIVGNYHEAAEVSDPLMALRTVALGAHPEHAAELEADFDKLVKGMEIKGVTQDLPRFRHYMDNMAKAVNVFGDTLRPFEYYQMFKYGRQSTQALSDEFMLKTAPTLAQELGGSSTGKALQNFYQHVVGGHMEHTAVLDLDKLGLIDRSKVTRTKTGAIKGLLPGGVKGWDLAARDPYAWINDVYLPALLRQMPKQLAGFRQEFNALVKSGKKPRDALNELAHDQVMQRIATDFGTGVATQLVGLLATQQPRIEKDWELQRRAKGLEAADQFMTEDAMVAWRSMREQIAGLAQEATGPNMLNAAKGLNMLAGAIHSVAEAAKEHPNIATGAVAGGGAAVLGGAGYLTYQWLTAGAALKGSAVALDEAAAALTRAAIVQGGGAAGPAKAGAAAAGAGAAWTGGTAFALGSTAMTAAAAAGAAMFIPDKVLPQEAVDTRRSLFDAGRRWLNRQITGAAPGEERLPELGGSASAGGNAGIGVGGAIEAAIADLKSSLNRPVDVTGKLEPVELKGEANVRISVAVKGGEMTDSFVSSSGHIKADLGSTSGFAHRPVADRHD